jgi:hypothetical protein
MVSRWQMSVTYRGGDAGPIVVEYDIDLIERGPDWNTVMNYDIEELFEIHDLIERGPDWNTVMNVDIKLNRRSDETR